MDRLQRLGSGSPTLRWMGKPKAWISIQARLRPSRRYTSGRTFRLVFRSPAIDVTNRKNPASSGYKVWIDAVEDDPPWTTYTDEILMVRLDGGEVRRLAHHRSRPYNTYNYTPRASVSRDASLVMFASNYGLPVDGYTSYVDAYLMGLNPETLRWNSTATTAAAARAAQLMP